MLWTIKRNLEYEKEKKSLKCSMTISLEEKRIISFPHFPPQKKSKSRKKEKQKRKHEKEIFILHT